MHLRLIFRHLVAAALPILVIDAGCNQSTEIPLANVPPPPPDFGKAITKPKTPRGGSPENVSDFNRGTPKR